MREGINPSKENNKLREHFYHRIIVPVHIPNLDDYFKHALQVLEICLESLFNSIHSKTAVTIIDNSCCTEVKELLDKYYCCGKITQLIRNRTVTGKIDSLMAAAKSCYEPLITVSDADVLFERGWMEEVEKAFLTFPEIGLISPCPVPKIWNYASSSTILGNFFRIRQERLIMKDKLLLFPKSVGDLNMYDDAPYLLTRQFYIERKGIKLVLGAGHFVATMRKEVVRYSPKAPALLKLAGKSMRTYIDFPIDKAGYFRVATSKVLAHHMGNTPEDWMTKLLEKNKLASKQQEILFRIPPAKRNYFIAAFNYGVKNWLINLAIKIGIIRLFVIKK